MNQNKKVKNKPEQKQIQAQDLTNKECFEWIEEQVEKDCKLPLMANWEKAYFYMEKQPDILKQIHEFIEKIIKNHILLLKKMVKPKDHIKKYINDYERFLEEKKYKNAYKIFIDQDLKDRFIFHSKARNHDEVKKLNNDFINIKIICREELVKKYFELKIES